MNYDDWRSEQPGDDGPTHHRRPNLCLEPWCIYERVTGEDYCEGCLRNRQHRAEQARDTRRKGTAA